MEKIFEQLHAMKEDAVDTAIQLGWKLTISALWANWLDTLTEGATKDARRPWYDYYNEEYPTDELKLQCMINHGFISTAAEAYIESNMK
jgi:hypothetical protein